MEKISLGEMARRYVQVIDTMEKTKDKEELISLEERRIIWHNKFIQRLKKEGISFKDREDVTRIAYLLAGEEP